jgi:hypothetical protein
MNKELRNDLIAVSLCSSARLWEDTNPAPLTRLSVPVGIKSVLRAYCTTKRLQIHDVLWRECLTQILMRIVVYFPYVKSIELYGQRSRDGALRIIPVSSSTAPRYGRG